MAVQEKVGAVRGVLNGRQQVPGKRRAKAGMGALQTAWEDEGLSREAAVFELVTLRREARALCFYQVVHEPRQQAVRC